MRYVIYILILMCLSCLGEDPSSELAKDSEVDATQKYVGSLWVCHHPETKFHNQPCVEDFYPNGCYIHGDNHSFCWLLTREECSEKDDERQVQACRLFEEITDSVFGSEN